MKHKKYLPVMATVSAVILLAGCKGIKDTGDKESIMEKSRLLAAEDTTVESTQVMTEMETQEETTEEITIIEKKPEEVTEELTEELTEEEITEETTDEITVPEETTTWMQAVQEITENEENLWIWEEPEEVTEEVTQPAEPEPVTMSEQDQKNAQAREVAQQIADSITGNSDLEKVRQAAQIVAEYSWNAVYTTEDPDYQTAYGVLCKGVYTCAGSTRALGLVLECMGYSWSHVNENQWSHQWCSVVMDGQQGWADGMGGIADYGECPFATGGTYVDSDGQWYIIP